MEPLAHAAGGHWLVEVGIYLGPFISIIAVVLFTDRRRRQREQRAGAEGTPAEGS
jgi:hypothetical protein